MKKITRKEHNQMLVDMLVYVDQLCRKNNIKYSLLGGTLIGAIRHKGMIPWDDDIDIVLMPEEYDKLIKVLEKEPNGRYMLLNHSIQKDYFYPFAKLIDTRTTLKEHDVRPIKNYGVYLDIFKYTYMPNNKRKAFFAYAKMNILRKAITLSVKRYDSPVKNFMSLVARAAGTERLIKCRENIMKKAATGKKFVILDLTGKNGIRAGFKREMIATDNLRGYIDCQFEGHTVMIFEKYDNILKQYFGDYMQLPPEEERETHPIESEYWKD